MIIEIITAGIGGALFGAGIFAGVYHERRALRKYLDERIKVCRDARDDGDEDAEFYVDAFQSIRLVMLGKLLPKIEEEENPDVEEQQE